jgi:uncharacterized circularly permuted ATP-grasp superfamily protein
MNKAFTNFKLFIQFSFFKIVILWAKSVQYTIGELWCWAAERHNKILEQASKLLIKSEQEQEINNFVKSMQRQAKITGARPKKDK